jgi:general secretion pathway protein G
MKKTSAGFTILEVMLVVILISILAAIVIPRFSVSGKRAKVQSCEMNRAIINKQVEAYYFVEATWPLDDMSDIKTNENYFPDGIPTCPVDMTSYELAPSPKHRVTSHREGADTHVF